MVAIFLILVVLLLLVARKARPAVNKQGVGLVEPPKSPTHTDVLKVATYNIQTGKDINGRRNLNRTSEVLRDADIVGVQEVYAPSLINLCAVGSSQFEKLAKHGGFGWLFSATCQRWLREHRGNAILSKVPIENWRVEMLPDQSGKRFRNMTIADVNWQGKVFCLINTHLHTRDGREDQLAVVLQEFAKHPHAILLGDFNSQVSTPALGKALKDVDISDAVTLSGLEFDDPERIDWILTKGFNVVGGKQVEKGVSDHPYYEVSLTYKRS